MGASTRPFRLRRLAAAAVTVVAMGFGALALASALRRRFVTYEVAGESMLPTLSPGDWVVVDRAGLRQRGEIVLAQDPRASARAIVKRIAAVGSDVAFLLGDNAGASTDSRHFGPVSLALVIGRVRWRYWPRPRALGRSPR